MDDHRRTTSQRAYQLPGWFFILTAVVSVLGFVAVGWVFLAGRLDLSPGAPQATASPSASAGEPRPGAGGAQPTSTGSPRNGADDDRSSIDVVVLNASEKAGLAGSVADAAEEAGWTVAEIGDWIYPAVVNAVYYPEGHEQEAGLLAEDLDIDSVRPVRSGMSTDELTVLLVYSP
jgi:hypothetical protein